MQGIWYHWRRGNIGALSVVDIKGSPQTGNRGLADLLLVKSMLKTAVLAKAAILFPESADWRGVAVANIAESFTSWFKSEDDQEKMWRAGRSPSENKLLGLLSDVVFGRVYDGPIKLAIKSSKTAAETMQTPGLVEYLQEIEAKRPWRMVLLTPSRGTAMPPLLRQSVWRTTWFSTSRGRTAPRSPRP